jgi:hypothetical protein
MISTSLCLTPTDQYISFTIRKPFKSQKMGTLEFRLKLKYSNYYPFFVLVDKDV